MKNALVWMSKARSSVKTIFGMPDYEKYLEHHNATHPDQEPLSERDFYLQRLKERYDSGEVTRCC
ncbi:YbdD/YjiX family protein [Tumebacillus sp. ITR2]|uniref:YbdD/YjiX family protein n=1 Tax=Tumebacillus amylolyticus TaxID=2801339 RepID=A0ABS1JAX7_9BACL|nr:YbdD/YjiX family protein [Tumebacillus amylolyticus]MBL0387335.1 YbdD/YjiX family protein [Tumebacillus amylolyticus]